MSQRIGANNNNNGNYILQGGEDQLGVGGFQESAAVEELEAAALAAEMRIERKRERQTDREKER